MAASDYAEVRGIARKTWADTYAGVIPEDVQKEFVERVYSDDMLAWRAGRGMFLVAEEGGSIVGFADFNRPFDDDRIVSLAAIYILPGEQRKGAGSMLLEEGIRLAPDANRLVVRFERGNHVARSFYERRGFERVGESEEDFLGHPSRMVEMVCPLRSP
jgi:GNAT superfamily N-acetyltransferase